EFNVSWRGIWRVATARTADGWSAEFAIPFRTLRYPGGDGKWGLNVERVIRRKNEETLWQSYQRDGGGFWRISNAGHITGLVGLPHEGLGIEVKPYTLGGGDQRAVSTGGVLGKPTTSSRSGAVGGD